MEMNIATSKINSVFLCSLQQNNYLNTSCIFFKYMSPTLNGTTVSPNSVIYHADIVYDSELKNENMNDCCSYKSVCIQNVCVCTYVHACTRAYTHTKTCLILILNFLIKQKKVTLKKMHSHNQLTDN
jgi:hypothetical protein